VTDIEDHLAAHNDNPRPYMWTATAPSIIDKLSRCKAVLETPH
jgi:hypothetical protein